MISITLILFLSLLLVGCANDEKDSDKSEENLGEVLEYTITGIEPGAGITELAKNTLDEYENLQGWELEESSTAGMTTVLGEAIDNEEPIIITGWTPHWMFAAYDLKFLDDPKGTLGDLEDIHTIVRKGFEEDMPQAYKILNAFHWETEDMETVMLDEQDSSFEEAASKWVEENQDRVNEWIEGTEKVDGQEIELVSTPWDSERASSSVIKVVLEQQGFEVTITDVDPAVLFQAVATGDADATVAPWLPTTHGFLYEEYKEDVIDLGVNLSGTKTGFAVPTYMNIDSIEDIPPKES